MGCKEQEEEALARITSAQDLLLRFGTALDAMVARGDFDYASDPHSRTARLAGRLFYLRKRVMAARKSANTDYTYDYDLASPDGVRAMCRERGLSEPAIADAVRLFVGEVPTANAILHSFEVRFLDLRTPIARVKSFKRLSD